MKDLPNSTKFTICQSRPSIPLYISRCLGSLAKSNKSNSHLQVSLGSRYEYEFVHNYRVLKSAFERLNVIKVILLITDCISHGAL